MITRERLMELVSYDPANGDFQWREKTWRRGHRGGSKFYRQLTIDGKSYLCHRLAWLYMHGEFPRGVIDHIDGNPLNNAFENLREATQSQNLGNQKINKNNQCGMKGVYRSRDKFRARIRKDGIALSIGTFDTREDAHAAYCEAAKAMYGEFARAA